MRDGFLDVLQHGLTRREVRLLRHVAHRGTLIGPGFAHELFVLPGHDLEQRRFARTVRPQHADLGAGIEVQVDVLEDLPLAVVLGQVRDVEDVLFAHASLGW